MRKLMEVGGVLAAVVLIALGIASIVVGASGQGTVKDNLREQKIVGSPDMTPAGITAEARKSGLNVATLSIPTCSVANKKIESGEDARCFAQYMTIHALEATGGQYYSQMPRYASADGKGTNVEALALKDAKGKPAENPERGVWVQETALSTALNTSYMAGQISLFGIAVGVALLLSGLGFAVLAIGGALRNPESVLGHVLERRAHDDGGAKPSPTGA
jgi:hypothetical protein